MFELTKSEIAQIETGEISEDLYCKTFDYLSHNNIMPYGIQKARTGDPYEYVGEYLYNEIKGI